MYKRKDSSYSCFLDKGTVTVQCVMSSHFAGGGVVTGALVLCLDGRQTGRQAVGSEST